MVENLKIFEIAKMLANSSKRDFGAWKTDVRFIDGHLNLDAQILPAPSTLSGFRLQRDLEILFKHIDFHEYALSCK